MKEYKLKYYKKDVTIWKIVFWNYLYFKVCTNFINDLWYYSYFISILLIILISIWISSYIYNIIETYMKIYSNPSF